MFFVELSPAPHTIKWVRAGHEPPLLYSSTTDSFSQLNGPGLVLGIDSSYSYEEHATENLMPGDIILIGTDGISEARNKDDEFFGRERIQECLKQFAHKPAKDMQVELLKKLDLFCASQKS